MAVTGKPNFTRVGQAAPTCLPPEGVKCEGHSISHGILAKTCTLDLLRHVDLSKCPVYEGVRTEQKLPP